MEEANIPVCTQTEYVDIGHGVQVQERRMDGVLAGVAYSHVRPDGTECPAGRESWIPVGPEGSDKYAWTLESESPLTLSPSILCPVCHHHGFIRGGAWIPA